MPVKILMLLLAMIYDALAVFLLLPFILLSRWQAKAGRYAGDRSSVSMLLRKLVNDGRETVIFYCSSVGEYEQAVPVIAMHEAHGYRAVVFFHSRAGLEHCSRMSDHEAYMTPYDMTMIWTLLLLQMRPVAFIINRHEFWPGAVTAAAWLSKLYVINYVEHEGMSLIDRCVLAMSRKVFCVNIPHRHMTKLFMAGDTRIDRLRQRHDANRQAIAAMRYVLYEHMPLGKRLVVIGNAYAADVAQLAKARPELYDAYRFLIVPARKGIGDVRMQGVLHIDEVSAIDWKEVRVAVLHTMGDLFEVYGCADVAWVGGGFAQGVHNCLEPAFYGIPVICGPLLDEQPEALAFLKDGRLNTFESDAELSLLLSELMAKDTKSRPETTPYSPTAYIFNQLYENHYPRKELVDARA